VVCRGGGYPGLEPEVDGKPIPQQDHYQNIQMPTPPQYGRGDRGRQRGGPRWGDKDEIPKGKESGAISLEIGEKKISRSTTGEDRAFADSGPH